MVETGKKKKVEINPDENRFYIPCDCIGTCGILAFRLEKDFEEVDPDLYNLGAVYYERHDEGDYVFSWWVLKERLKRVWDILRGKDDYLYEVLLDNEKLQEFKAWINSK